MTPAPISVIWLGSPAGVTDPSATLLAADSSFRVSIVRDARELAAHVRQHRPKLVAIDLDTAAGDVLRAVEQVMSATPTPILVIADSPAASARAIPLIAAGALDATQVAAADVKRGNIAELKRMIRLLSPIAVVARRTPSASMPAANNKLPARLPEIVAVGASTGGPPALGQMLKRLPARSKAAFLVVQHMSKEFVPGFVDWLAATISLPVAVARDGDELKAGRVLVSPGDRHMVVAQNGRIALIDGEPRHGCRPSVDALFESVAEVAGSRAIGVLLTGMGRDGAEGLLRMRERDACTIAQSQSSAVIYGMPGAAVEIGAAQYVMDLEDIGDTLRRRLETVDA